MFEESDDKYKKGSILLAHSLRDWWLRMVVKPFKDYIIKKQLSPNYVTTMGLGVNMVAAYCFHKGLFFFAGALILFGGHFDLIDGLVARETNQVTIRGAFFDSVIDRATDAVLLLGLISYYRTSVMLYLLVLTLFGTLMVSYTKARAEALNLKCDVGWMQRPERIVYLGIGSMFSSILSISLMPFYHDPKNIHQYLLIIVIITIGVLANITAFQRGIYIFYELKKIDEKNNGSKNE